MTSERWQQIKAILADAIEHDDPIERATFVENSCVGDPLLKLELEALLAYANHPRPNDNTRPSGVTPAV